MIGKDASARFNAKHGSSSSAQSKLNQLAVGSLNQDQNSGGFGANPSPSDKVTPVIGQAPGGTNSGTTTGNGNRGGFTISQIQSSNSLAVINGKVVDLSSWVSQHPGGAAAIQDCK